MLSSKRTSFFSNLLSNSQADDLNDAAREWKMSRIGHSEQFSPCECCGTAMKRHAIIENEVTGAILIIGLNCLENLRCTQEGLELPSLKEYVAMGKAILKGKIKQLYEDDTPVVFRNWRNWFLSLEDIPDDLKEGVAQLRYWGILSDEFVGRFIKYHDDNRLFPREVLIPDDIYHYLEVKLAIPIPDYLTINQARKYLEYKNKKEYLEVGVLKLKAELTHIKQKRGKLFKKVNNYGYRICPKCLMICEPTHFHNHLIREHGCQVCPECNELVAIHNIRIHLSMQHHYKDCPVCHEFCSNMRNINVHLQEKHDSKFCPHCNIVIKLNEFDNHLQQKHRYKICPICKQLVKDFRFHIEKEHKDFQFCALCKCIVKKAELGSHLHKKHGFQICAICRMAIQPEHLNIHLIKEHNREQCPMCEMLFKSTEIEDHLWQEHGNVKCRECAELTSDIRTHLIEEHHYDVCPICNKICKSIYKHLKEEHDYISCSKCKNVFKSSELDDSLGQTYDYLKWRCPACSRRYRCHVCGKYFEHKENRTRHIKEVHWVKWGKSNVSASRKSQKKKRPKVSRQKPFKI
jgi:hypothetical protein